MDPEILDLLWRRFHLDISFLRQHLDYKGFRNEAECPKATFDLLEEERGKVEETWTFSGRWNPIRLPSETRASVLRLSVDSECLSVCCKNGISKSSPLCDMHKARIITGSTGIVLVRSKSVYLKPLSPGEQLRSAGCSNPCTDLFAATVDLSSDDRELPDDPTEISFSIVHFYARLLLLRCYEDYHLRHDPEPIELYESDKVSSTDLPHITAMHNRRLELVKFRQHLSGYLGLPTTKHERSDSPNHEHREGGHHNLLTDVDMLLSLYDSTMRVYEMYIDNTISETRNELASEQLEETRESKATAISLGKLSNLAFLFIPLNFVCAMLGMNLSIFGQGSVPVWVFLMLLLFFGLLTYIPIYVPRMNVQRRRAYKVAYHLAWRTIPAGFWYFVFYSTHNHQQNFEILNSGLSQTFLGHTGYRSKGWQDGGLFKNASWGSEAFWKEKVKGIFLSVKELNQYNRDTQSTV